MTREKEIDALIEKAVFSEGSAAREGYRREIRDLAAGQGIWTASIQGLYEAAGNGLYSNKTVPAINVRGITYQVARAIFRAALRHKVGAFIFEIARSEIIYTAQRPAEYTACVLAAAVVEGFTGPVFLQGDHFQINRKKYGTEPDAEVDAVNELVKEAIDAGFYNIDIDASTIVDLERPSLESQQEQNCRITAGLTDFIRTIEPTEHTVSVGGEIGEVGSRNSTVADLKAFMDGYLSRLTSGNKGISKISVQTGTTHGGVVLPDGSVASVKVDFKTLAEISKIAREEYGLAGAVQHGASTLPDEAFDMFPEANTAEVHLATGFQNLIYDSPHFPGELRDKIYRHLAEKYANEKKPGETEDQFYYKTRKKAFGDFKKEMWSLPEENLEGIREMLTERFDLLFRKLAVTDTVELVSRFVKPG